MKLLIPSDIQIRMRWHMRRAGRREIGGILMGEEIGEQLFKIVDFSVDTETGLTTQFLRNADLHEQSLTDFFERTGNDYRRFNYLGEWHTHPSFDVHPSVQDIHSMQNLVHGSRGVEFAVLLVTRLRWLRRIECSALLFTRFAHPASVELISERSKKI